MRARKQRAPRRTSRFTQDGRTALGEASQQVGAHSDRVTVDYSQEVDVIFAFHRAGYKPNARSYNVVVEDACHFLKYGTVLHGEWFIDGQRVPGGDHRKQLPPGLSERPLMDPKFPEFERMQGVSDGCPNQFDYGTNYHVMCRGIAAWPSR
eukprot:7349300-Prymnesium_polylepis.1